MENILYKELKFENINKNLLDNFNRYQEVKRCYRNENGSWIIKNNEFVENWDKSKLENKTINFSRILSNNYGYIFGAYENKKLIGFAVLLNNKFGTKKQYIQLENLHVSFDYRHKGIGKKLFELCIKKTKEMGIEKIYISANTSEETQKFYLSIGCKDAIEINKKLAEEEPYDRQMEYEIQ